MDITPYIVGLLGGGGISGLLTILLNRKDAREKTADQIIERLTKENSRLENELSEERKDKKEALSLYRECLSIKESLVKQIHELEVQVQQLRNELIQKNIIGNSSI